MIDYNAASRTYDNTRTHSDALIDRFCSVVPLDSGSVVLDFGCGTGNYLNRIHQRFACRCRGIEPSDGMRAKASEKSSALQIVNGNHADIPFPAGTFDFSFMTDVIHHVPDISSMLLELRRVLKDRGLLCVVTESHAQIDGRFYNRYFPSLAKNEKRRYPDVAEIISKANDAGLFSSEIEILSSSMPSQVSETFIKNVAEKNYSMFRLLSDLEFTAGLLALTSDLGRSFESSSAGETMLWFRKSAQPIVSADPELERTSITHSAML